tara:strand:- start:15866 stop:16825 length:960 start_codon:yes stop_codon:yes gene_type:complete
MLQFFLHIGFSKSASSWLQAYFKQVKNIFFIEKSRFFAPLNNDLNKYGKGQKYYYSLFEEANINDIKLESDEHIILPDIHPLLSIHGTTLESVKLIIDRIKNTIEQPKIILVIRNHQSLILSRYSQYIVDGGKLTFKDFFNEIINCSLDHKNYFENYYYLIINELYNKFGNENVHIIFQENLLKDEDDTLVKLNKFMDVPLDFNVKRNLFNQRMGLSLWGVKILRIINLFLIKEKGLLNQNKGTYKPNITRIPYFIYFNLFVRGIRFFDYSSSYFIRRNIKELLDDDIINKINNIFSDDNKKLNNLFDENLEEKGYFIS